MEGWLSRIVTNAFLDDVRRRRRRPVASLGDAPEGAFGTAPSADEALAAHTLPSDVEQALLQVPEEFRVAVVLCDVVGLSYQQIGEALDVPVGTVRSRIHRGRALLREALS
jgi:RNA polymerase sigma-70 factor (ECF subfamily)